MRLAGRPAYKVIGLSMPLRDPPPLHKQPFHVRDAAQTCFSRIFNKQACGHSGCPDHMRLCKRILLSCLAVTTWIVMHALQCAGATCSEPAEDPVFDGTMTWPPSVEQTTTMVRNHENSYRRGPGYVVDKHVCVVDW